MSALSARRTAILSAIAAAAQVVLQSVQTGTDANPPYVALLAIVAAGGAYLVAYQVSGLLEKLAISTIVSVAGSVAAGMLAGRTTTEIALTALIVAIGALGVQAALPSTAGSVQRQFDLAV